jgi:hypothetical protein
MTIRDTYLSVLDGHRGRLTSVWDLRRYVVEQVSQTWTGDLPGEGTTTGPVYTPITVGDGGRPKVAQLSQQDVIASGGLYQDQDLRIGPLTPPIAGGGGTEITALDPASAGPAATVMFRITGPGCEGGALYRKVGQDVSANFRYSIIVRRMAVE